MSVEIQTDTIIDKVFAGFKKITPALIAVSLASASVLFLPIRILELLGLNELSGNARTVIGILFLLSTILIITIALSCCWKFVTRKIKHTKVLKNLKKRFLSLAPEQKEIVLEMLKNEDKVIVLDCASGNTLYLQNNNFIYRPGQLITPGLEDDLSMKYAPHPWLIDLYNREPNLFEK